MTNQTIFTLDARDNIFLEVARSYFALSPSQVFREINGLFILLVEVLAAKKVNYQGLKNSLVPCPDRNEAVFVFDSTPIESSWYGYEVFNRLIPAFDRRGTHSVLSGDYIGNNKQQEKLYQEFCKNVELQRSCKYVYSNQFFMVYVNNLSDQMVQNIRHHLSDYEPYVGFINLNFSSYIKTYLSTILCKSFLKHQNIILMGHEDDRDNSEDINILGYPFVENGYIYRSLQSTLFDLFLSYKIERSVFPGFESDTQFSLNAVSTAVIPIRDCEIQIEDKKFQYLVENKTGKLKKAGLLSVRREDLEELIRERIESNYIYNLSYLQEHDTIKFNTVIEVFTSDVQEIVKLTVALEYKPVEKRLRVITMF